MRGGERGSGDEVGEGGAVGVGAGAGAGGFSVRVIGDEAVAEVDDKARGSDNGFTAEPLWCKIRRGEGGTEERGEEGGESDVGEGVREGGTEDRGESGEGDSQGEGAREEGGGEEG